MPKASINKNHGLSAGKNKVRLSGKIIAVEPESVSFSVKHLPDKDLWLRILGLYGAHDFAAFFRIECVHRWYSAAAAHLPIEGLLSC